MIVLELIPKLIELRHFLTLIYASLYKILRNLFLHFRPRQPQQGFGPRSLLQCAMYSESTASEHFLFRLRRFSQSRLYQISWKLVLTYELLITWFCLLFQLPIHCNRLFHFRQYLHGQRFFELLAQQFRAPLRTPFPKQQQVQIFQSSHHCLNQNFKTHSSSRHNLLWWLIALL